MSWLFLLLAALAFLVAFTTHSTVVLGLSILVALGFSAAWLMGLMAQRMGDTARSETMIIDPQELRRLREQAEARRNEASGANADAALSNPTVSNATMPSTGTSESSRT
jgi:hypothetical protein